MIGSIHKAHSYKTRGLKVYFYSDEGFLMQLISSGIAYEKKSKPTNKTEAGYVEKAKS